VRRLLLLLAFLPAGCSKARQSADHASTAEATERLKKLGLGIHDYNDTFGYLPAGVHAADNSIGLSWRVELLPHIGEKALYEQFNRKEPWDSPHNKQLIDRMPALYATPSVAAPAGHTHVRAFVAVAGPHKAMLPGPAELNLKPARPVGSPVLVRKLSQFMDGTSHSFMLVEATEAVPWTKPEGLEFDPDRPLPKLGVMPGGFLVLMGDGSVRLVPDTVPPSSLRFGITIDDTQVLPPDLEKALWGETGR
jgi:hypothetical protein